MTKTQRQHRISELLEREVISTAAQIVVRLNTEGIAATPSNSRYNEALLEAARQSILHGGREVQVPT